MAKFTASDLYHALAINYVWQMPGWALLREVTLTDELVLQANQDFYASLRNPDISYAQANEIHPLVGSPSYRRIDALLMRTAANPKNPQYERIAIEIKVSRADFFRDTAEKRRVWETVTHRFAYCTPAGLVKPSEVPEGCGLLEFTPSGSKTKDGLALGRIDWKKRAPRRKHTPDPFSEYFLAYLARRASSAEFELSLRKRKYGLHHVSPWE